MSDIAISFGPLDVLALMVLAMAPVALIVGMAARAAFGRGGAARMAGLSVAVAGLVVLEFGLSLGTPSPFGFGPGVRGGLAAAAIACWVVSAVLPGYWRRAPDAAILCAIALGLLAWLVLS